MLLQQVAQHRVVLYFCVHGCRSKDKAVSCRPEGIFAGSSAPPRIETRIQRHQSPKRVPCGLPARPRAPLRLRQPSLVDAWHSLAHVAGGWSRAGGIANPRRGSCTAAQRNQRPKMHMTCTSLGARRRSQATEAAPVEHRKCRVVWHSPSAATPRARRALLDGPRAEIAQRHARACAACGACGGRRAARRRRAAGRSSARLRARRLGRRITHTQ